MKNVSREQKNKTSGLFTSETFGMTLILFSVVSVILLFLSDVLFGRQWFYTQFIFGVFGYSAFALFVALGFMGVMAVLGRKGTTNAWKKIILVVLFLIFLISLVQVITANEISYGFKHYIDFCYNAGESGFDSCTGGGALFAVLVYPAIKYLTPVGCYILFPILMIADVFVLFRVSLSGAVKRATGKSNIKSMNYVGIKEYPDDDFDFSDTPIVATVNKLYHGEGPSAFAEIGKKDKKSEKDRALNILYSDSNPKKSNVINSGNMKNFAQLRTGDFSRDSYQGQVDSDFARKVNYVKTPPAIDMEAYKGNNFGSNRANVSERRYADGARNIARNDINEMPNAISRGSREEERNNVSDINPFTENRSLGDFGDNEFKGNVKRRDISYRMADNTGDDIKELSSGRERFDSLGRIEESKREDKSPFAEKWNTKNEARDVSSLNLKEIKEEDVKPSNITKYNLETERKAIYIEPDTGDAVMPDEETSEKKKSAGKAEQIPLMEKNEYIGIPEMPIRYKYNNPPISLYNDNPKKLNTLDDGVEERCNIIEKTLESFNVPAHVENVVKGPTITRYEISIPEGIAVSRVPPRASDLAMRLEVEAVRIEAPIPGKNLVGIEVPNKVKEMVGMKELLLEKEYQKSSPDALSIVLGEDVVGNPVITDLTKTPHLLVAGATGMGKSVFLNALIMSLVTKYGPNDLRLVLVDPKQVEFSIYENLPHLLIDQIITEASLCVGILDWAIDEMEQRYKIFRSCYAQKIDEYNNSINPKTQRRMPKIVIIIDELGDLFSISPQVKHDIEDRIRRLTQKARAAGIHVVVATQRPDVTVITGVIKTNLPSRIAFKVLNYADSNTILNDGGADKLLGNGDMIFKTSNSALLKRIQGAYVSKDELLRVLTYIKENNECYYDDNAKKYLDAKKASTQNAGTAASVSFGNGGDNENDPSMFNDIPIRNLRALKLAIERKAASISLFQRSLSVGYSTAGRMIDWMEKMNYISSFAGAKSREVLITMDEFERLYGEANLD